MGAELPAGTVISYVGTEGSLNTPALAGWLPCLGQPLKIADYPALWQAIGSGFGQDNSDNFYLPDLRGMFLRGIDDGQRRDPDASGRTAQTISGQAGNGNTGDNVGSVQQDALAVHRHALGHAVALPDRRIAVVSSFDRAMAHPTPTGFAGDSGETRPKNVYVYYLIWTGAA